MEEVSRIVLASQPGDEVLRRILGLSKLASNSNTHAGLVAFSALLILLRTVSYKDQEENAARVSIPYEVCSQLARAITFGFACVLASRQDSGWPTPLLFGYAFTLGIFGRVHWKSRRKELIYHVNSILGIALVIFLASDGLPLVLVYTSREFHSNAIKIALLTALASCNIIALLAPQEWIPPSISQDLIQGQSNEKPSPEETCSYFSYYVSYGWLTSLIWNGSRRGITIEDLPALPSYDEPLLWLPRILDARRRGGSTFRTIAILFRAELAMMIFLSTITAVLELIVPFATYQLLDSLARPGLAVINPYVWVCLLFLGPNFRAIAFQHSAFIITRLSVRLKISLVQELFQKAIRRGEKYGKVESSFDKVNQGRGNRASPSKHNQSSTMTGEIETLMSYDVDAIIAARDIVLCSVAGTIVEVLAMMLLYRMLGWPSMVGLAVLLACLPLPVYFARRLSIVQGQIMKTTQIRISKIAECLPAIRTIKYFAWEEAMSDRINEARQVEQTIMWKRALYTIAIIMSTDLAPFLTILVMFSCYVLGTGKPLTTAIAFTSLTLVEIIRMQFVLMSSVINKVSQAKVSLHRVDQYFEKVIEAQRHPSGPPAFKDATFSRSQSSQFKLMHMNIEFIQNGLNVITGPSGSGKTSLLLSLLGETILESGKVTCPSDVGFASQTAWLQHATIRVNILFNSDFEQDRYDSVIRACCLISDFEQLPCGDLTNIGENGTTLSGGQRQRVALARALYSKASLILLDDAFSALDVHTAVHVFNHCFCSDLLLNRTTILVTQVPWIADEADFLVKLDGGTVVLTQNKQGMVRIPVNASQIMLCDEVKLDQDTIHAEQVFKDEELSLTRSSYVEPESHKRNTKALFYRYMVAFGGHRYAILALFTAFLAQTSFFVMMFWLSVWVGAYDHEDSVDVRFYLGVYAALIASFNFLTAVEGVVFRNGAWIAAKTLHQNLIKAVFGVSLKDINSLDGRIVESIQRTTGLLLRLLFRVTAVGSIMPIFALPTAVMCLIGYVVGDLYTKTAALVKRLASESQSPVFAHFSEVLAGITVIRAKEGMAEIMQRQLAEKLCVHARAWEAQFNLNRWVYMRSELAASTIALGAGIIALTRSGTVSAGLIGFSLTNAVTLGQTTIQLVRAMNELEIEMTSFDRVQEYAELPAEEESENIAPVPAKWPSSGIVEFCNVTVRYAKNGPDVLKNVSFSLKAGERVAIVGRSGSGKSTLALSCLRVAHVVSGSIFYDGIDIAQLPLRHLRQSLTIIPQETILFSGDIADNLDPTNTFDRHDLENALNACSNISALTNHNATGEINSKMSLSTPVTAGAQNFSHGQRQILGLARALVKRSKLILLDEATASMDYETDSAIQEVLRAGLKGSTLITIAHRLRTIIDYDRVIVMSEGKIMEMGSPKELFEKKGLFADMVRQGGEAEELVKLFQK
ncbi:ATP-binding cassette transporter abc4 [Hyphodiscus hymeniophilus]|uniref:ATP-binding cassette transporter abc4 n=1 Tax=Hyphodiscus hymeniophilus TaxID=353542 RepID=A0A9P7AZE0_9HELO|nr:ATP-binding cassette transporter abc4 [Hyphodiscus hymeniophilus]